MQHEDFIELMGRHLEEEGMPRIAGRLMGALIINEEVASLDDLAEQLQVSKASVSSNARFLESIGVAERITFPGDRRDFYRLAPNAEELALQRILDRQRLMLQRLEVGREMEGVSEKVRCRFESLMTFVSGAVRHLEEAIDCRKRPS